MLVGAQRVAHAYGGQLHLVAGAPGNVHTSVNASGLGRVLRIYKTAGQAYDALDQP